MFVKVSVLPADSGHRAGAALAPEGVFLPNGPGDPAAVTAGIQLAEGLLAQADLPRSDLPLAIRFLAWPSAAALQADLWPNRV